MKYPPGPWRWGDWSCRFGTLEDPENMNTLESGMGDSRVPIVRASEPRPVEILSCGDPIESEDLRRMLVALPDLFEALRDALPVLPVDSPQFAKAMLALQLAMGPGVYA